eukprot:8459138-Alexandrium_andersonii.AAC.1
MLRAGFGPREPLLSWADSGSARKNGAERTPRELQGPMLRSSLGPRSSSSEHLKQVCTFQVPRATPKCK